MTRKRSFLRLALVQSAEVHDDRQMIYIHRLVYPYQLPCAISFSLYLDSDYTLLVFFVSGGGTPSSLTDLAS